MSGHSQYKPKSNFAKWLERRLRSSALCPTHSLPIRRPKILIIFGPLARYMSFVLVAQIITGVVLAMHYTPEVTLAFNSVENIMRDVNWGWALRYAHANRRLRCFF